MPTIKELLKERDIDYKRTYDSITINLFIESNKSNTKEGQIDSIDYIIEGLQTLKRHIERLYKLNQKK